MLVINFPISFCPPLQLSIVLKEIGNIRRRYLQELPRRSFGDRRVSRWVISGPGAQIIAGCASYYERYCYIQSVSRLTLNASASAASRAMN